jgi:sortase A
MTTVRQAAPAPRGAVPRRLSRPAKPPTEPPADATVAAGPTTTPAPRQVTMLSVITWSLTAISGLSLAFLAFLLVLSPLQEARAQDLLYRDFRAQLAATTAPFGDGDITPGAPVAIIEIGDLGVRQVVVEGTGGRDLRNGPGHARATSFPGQAGISEIYGRSTTYGAPFKDIATLAAGDKIRIVTGQGSFLYVVRDVRRNGDPEPPPPSSTQSMLTLVSTEGDVLQPTTTVYVDAMLAGDVAVSPPRPLVFVPPFEAPMASDTSALLPLTLWMLMLLGVAAFAVWGATRWGKLQTWVVTFPLALMALWGVCDSAALLLPNLM